MKWTKEIDKKLIELINSGKRHDEIGVFFNVTKKTISNRCFRLGLKTNYYKDFICKQCNKKFTYLISQTRNFCSKSCSNTFSNTGRIHSENSKEKARKKLIGKKQNQERKDKTTGKNNGMYIDGRSRLKYLRDKDKVDGKKKCRCCAKYNIEKTNKIICEYCRIDYYKYYRPSCEFDFKINNYPSEFNFDLVKKYGWYSPSNKGNNLNGVSKDHLYSVRDGFINKINYKIIKHPANCNIVIHKDNNSKNYNSSITIEELIEKINIWNEKYNIKI